ncbi:MAG: glycerate kinase [Chryseolinea sp.]
MTILIAPDKFKGTLTALQVCTALKDALLSINSSLDVVELPLADGGEGTCELLTEYCHGSFVDVEVRDPLNRKIFSRYGVSSDGKIAFVEMAKASGLQLLLQAERNPWLTSTVGTGDMIRHALDRGVKQIMMGIGGSATNDAGMGMADALGIKFFSAGGERLEGLGQNMWKVNTIDTTSVHPSLKEVNFTLFCDVNNPLFGPDGAAYVFAPQKGADPNLVRMLDDGLRSYATCLTQKTSRDVDFPGAGAGGGLPATLKAFASVDIRAGMEYIIDFIGLEDHVCRADIIITGEGKIDEQTMAGKVVKGVAGLAAKHNKPLIVIAGASEISEASLRALSVHTLITLVRDDTTTAEAMTNAQSLIGRRIRELQKLFK